MYDESGDLMPGAVPTFTATSSIATVNAQGVVTAVGAGQGIITVSSGAASTEVKLVFTGHPAGVPGPRLSLGSRPFGVAVGADSMLLATQLAGAAMGKSRTDLSTFAGSIAVGAVPTSVANGAGADTAYVANQLSGSLGIVNRQTGVQVSTVAIPGDPFRVLKGPGDIVYVSSNIDSVFGVITPLQAIGWRFAVGADPNGMALGPGNASLYVTNMSSGDLTEINLVTLATARTIVLGGTPQEVLVSPDGTELYVANEGSLLQVVDLATGNVTSGGAGTGNLFGRAVLPDGKVLVGTRPGSGQVVVIDRVTRQVLSTVTTGGTPRRVSMDLLGSIAAVANESGWVDLIR